mmetsp:Transcript_14714/g.21598  ORF Transcript_14714/g.21598 Transcript_14714/m.21598 type:complete len:84 (-) Transcript_14714:46-297(-)
MSAGLLIIPGASRVQKMNKTCNHVFQEDTPSSLPAKLSSVFVLMRMWFLLRKVSLHSDEEVVFAPQNLLLKETLKLYSEPEKT